MPLDKRQHYKCQLATLWLYELSLLKIFKYCSETTAFDEQGRGLFAWHATGHKTANLGGPEIHHRVFRQNTT